MRNVLDTDVPLQGLSDIMRINSDDGLTTGELEPSINVDPGLGVIAGDQL